MYQQLFKCSHGRQYEHRFLEAVGVPELESLTVAYLWVNLHAEEYYIRNTLDCSMFHTGLTCRNTAVPLIHGGCLLRPPEDV